MNKKKLFIDGREGTTGLGIVSRIENRDDVELIVLPDEFRKIKYYLETGEELEKVTKELEEARKKAINESDITILCLPDEAAKESVSLCENKNTIILDASTAHRIAEGWVYGLAELEKGQSEKIRNAKRMICASSQF